jgi:hypothetical protein
LTLIFATALGVFVLRALFDRESGSGAAWIVWLLPFGACGMGLRFGGWLLTRRQVLTIDHESGTCALAGRGQPPPWPVRETARAFSVSLGDVKGFVVVSRPIIDRFAPPGRLGHAVAAETRDGQRYELGWDFLDDARAAALAVDELRAALQDRRHPAMIDEVPR